MNAALAELYNFGGGKFASGDVPAQRNWAYSELSGCFGSGDFFHSGINVPDMSRECQALFKKTKDGFRLIVPTLCVRCEIYES